MPEGDTIHHAAKRVGDALVDQEIVAIETPHPRHARDRWPERLRGRAVKRVDAHGKHLFVRFEGNLTLHSHLRMTGKWGVYRPGQRWRRSPRRAWLVIRTGEHEVVQFDGPVLELMTDSRTRFDQRLAGLGTDVIAARLRRCRVPAAAARGRPHARARRRAARSAQRRGLREHLEVRVLFHGGHKPLAAAGRGLRRRRPPRRTRGSAADEGVGGPRRPDRDRTGRAVGLPTHGHALQALPHPHPRARPGRGQSHYLLVPAVPGLIRVGHKGADHVAPGNTLASFEAALEHGVDMIEFDVLRTRDGRLVLSHDWEDAEGRECLTLEEGLDHFAGEAYGAVELDVDLKLPGYEREVVEGLAERNLTDRALVSTMYLESLDAIGRLAPGLRRGWSVPRVKRDYTKTPLALVAYGVARWWRLRLPGRAARLIRAGGCEAIMCHWLLVSSRLVRSVHEAGGQVYVWTVDDAERIAKFEALGVDGVITNDPRLFDPVV